MNRVIDRVVIIGSRMLKRIIQRKWWITGPIVVLLVIRSFEPFKSSALVSLMAALVIGVVTVVLMAIIPASSH
jgi:hypothetical protein